MMQQVNLNIATFIGIDAHTGEHTALAINRFEETKGKFAFENSYSGIAKFLSWIPTVDGKNDNVVIGVEGGGAERHTLVRSLVKNYDNVYEINPLYTKQRRDYGTRGDKSDAIDAKLIAEVLTRKLSELPKIIESQLNADHLILRKTVWFYEEITERGAAIQHQIKQLKRELSLAQDKREHHALSIILKAKEQDLKRIRSTQRKYKKELENLLPIAGRNLTTMTGISIVLAAKLLSHIDRIERFKNLDKFIRYAGISPLEKSSGKTKKYIKANRGDRALNSDFYMLALSQLCHDPKAKIYFQKKLTEGKTRKHALRCLMKRVACIVYGMLKSGEPYRR